jgi:hypothetical protein
LERLRRGRRATVVHSEAMGPRAGTVTAGAGAHAAAGAGTGCAIGLIVCIGIGTGGVGAAGTVGTVGTLRGGVGGLSGSRLSRTSLRDSSVQGGVSRPRPTWRGDLPRGFWQPGHARAAQRGRSSRCISSRGPHQGSPQALAPPLTRNGQAHWAQARRRASIAPRSHTRSRRCGEASGSAAERPKKEPGRASHAPPSLSSSCRAPLAEFLPLSLIVCRLVGAESLRQAADESRDELGGWESRRRGREERRRGRGAVQVAYICSPG